MKAVLRKQLLQLRNALSKKENAYKSHQVFKQLLPYMQQAACVGIYKSFGSEVNTEEMIAYLLKHHKKTGVPVCEKEGIMQFFEIHEHTQYQKNSMGIWEPLFENMIHPSEFDLIIVPMLGFYEHQRLGYGRGYYDRYLLQCTAYKIGIAFSVQAIKFDEAPYDIHMDKILHN